MSQPTGASLVSFFFFVGQRFYFEDQSKSMKKRTLSPVPFCSRESKFFLFRSSTTLKFHIFEYFSSAGIKLKFHIFEYFSSTWMKLKCHIFEYFSSAWIILEFHVFEYFSSAEEQGVNSQQIKLRMRLRIQLFCFFCIISQNRMSKFLR